MEGLLVNVDLGTVKWNRAVIEEVKEDSVVLRSEEGQKMEVEWDAIVEMTWC